MSCEYKFLSLKLCFQRPFHLSLSNRIYKSSTNDSKKSVRGPQNFLERPLLGSHGLQNYLSFSEFQHDAKSSSQTEYYQGKVQDWWNHYKYHSLLLQVQSNLLSVNLVTAKKSDQSMATFQLWFLVIWQLPIKSSAPSGVWKAKPVITFVFFIMWWMWNC